MRRLNISHVTEYLFAAPVTLLAHRPCLRPRVDRARAAPAKAGLLFRVLDAGVETVAGQVSIRTMHMARALDFRVVAVMACDDEVIPLQSRIEAATDDANLEEVCNTERHLLYGACTRARDQLPVTRVDPASELLDDLFMSSGCARRVGEQLEVEEPFPSPRFVPSQQHCWSAR